MCHGALWRATEGDAVCQYSGHTSPGPASHQGIGTSTPPAPTTSERRSAWRRASCPGGQLFDALLVDTQAAIDEVLVRLDYKAVSHPTAFISLSWSIRSWPMRSPGPWASRLAAVARTDHWARGRRKPGRANLRPGSRF